MSDGWNIAGVIASSVSSLIAAGALWITVVTQRRQQDEKLRAQAAKVTFSTAIVEGVLAELRADNRSDLPIYNASIGTYWDAVDPRMEEQMGNKHPYNSDKAKFRREAQRLESGEYLVFLYERPRPRDIPLDPRLKLRVDAELFFYDAAGNECRRHLDGSLKIVVPRTHTLSTNRWRRLFNK